MQDTIILNTILDELRASRADISNLRQETTERVTKLETQVYPLIDNGQPGRVTLVERTVQKLREWRIWQIGVAAGVSGVVSVVAWVIAEVAKR